MIVGTCLKGLDGIWNVRNFPGTILSNIRYGNEYYLIGELMSLIITSIFIYEIIFCL